MGTNNEWISFGEAAVELSQEFGVSLADAKAELSQIVAEQKIRSIDETPPASIRPARRPLGRVEIDPAELAPLPAPLPNIDKPETEAEANARFTALVSRLRHAVTQAPSNAEVWIHQPSIGRWTKVSRADLREWLHQPSQETRRYVGKRPRIKSHLAKLYPDGVPDPAFCPRKGLLRELLRIDPSLAPLDDGILKTAIDEYNNAAVGGADPKQSEIIRNRGPSD
jgi:hypothetical protein